MQRNTVSFSVNTCVEGQNARQFFDPCFCNLLCDFRWRARGALPPSFLLFFLLAKCEKEKEKGGGARGRRAPSFENRKSKIQKSRSKNWRAFCPSTHPLSGKETVLHCILLRHSFAKTKKMLDASETSSSGSKPKKTRLPLKKIDLLTKARALWQQLLSLLSPFLFSRKVR